MSKHIICSLAVIGALLVGIVFAVWHLRGRTPVAVLRVVDSAGQPIADVVVQPEGLRTKPGPYSGGWYSWPAGANAVSNLPVRTDSGGTARVPYPTYVFEKVETGVLCLSANHPAFVPARPECTISIAPPAGAPIATLFKYWWERMLRGPRTSRPAPIVLEKGTMLKITARGGPAGSSNATLYAQVTGLSPTDTNSWFRPEPGVLVTRRLAPGPFALRAIKIDKNGRAWFSPVTTNTAVAGQTNILELPFQPGVTVRGALDDTVPRPIQNGRVIAHVWPTGLSATSSPPQWHAWSEVKADGRFEMDGLPEGDLEIVALCQGFISTNGPGTFSMRYPQKHSLGTADLVIAIGMEPTARLEVMVLDDTGKPLPGVRVMTWPNVRYGEWSATILASDCYNSVDRLINPLPNPRAWDRSVPDFEGTTDSNGLAVLPNLPADVKQFSAQHPQYVLPAVQQPGWSRKERVAVVSLIAGETNHASVWLEPADHSPIADY